MIRLASATRGAVYVEFLIVFFPVMIMFLGLLQLAFLFSVHIAVDHAAVNAARAAAVVVGDDKRNYGNEAPDQVRKGGARYAAIRRAAVLTLGGFIVDGTISNVTVSFPPNDSPGQPGNERGTYAPLNFNDPIDKIRVALDVTAACKIMLVNRLGCNWLVSGMTGVGFPTKTIHAEAMYPYQGARYDYP